ncbi:MAG: hypothetical protein HC843_00320 [Sphingomonadales bacterium]|nr:hypothetical protein [Sphingomonadales bacterium]
MGIPRPQNNQMKAIAMAIGGSVIAAAGTMFIPVSILETITGATGLTEIFPATAAPLGDTARALIAFGAGVIALFILLALVLRPKEAQEVWHQKRDHSVAEANNIAPKASLMDRIAGFAIPKMPWQRGEDDIFDLTDLPKLREQDSHPDAPVRKPISALTDLAGADLIGDKAQKPVAPTAEVGTGPEEYFIPETAEAADCVSETIDADPAPAPDLVPAPDPAPAPKQTASLAEMVAQMEAAVAERKKQLVELEKVASQMIASQGAVQGAAQGAVQAEAPAAIGASIPAGIHSETAPLPVPSPAQEILEPKVMSRPPLEAVPTPPQSSAETAAEAEMDEALNAALETLKRMNNR